jgi:hypothetical protein
MDGRGFNNLLDTRFLGFKVQGSRFKVVQVDDYRVVKSIQRTEL